jgi:3-hydroxyisobutyrate dehydrogenase
MPYPVVLAAMRVASGQRGNPHDMKVSVLGLGRMGQAIAARLLDQGYDVIVWNRTVGRDDELIKLGARRAESIGDAVGRSQTVITSLSNDQAVRDVVRGPGGVVESLDGQLYVDCTTSSPELSAELAEHVEGFVAMPLLGSPDAVRAGAAICLVGSDDDTAARAKDLAIALGGRQLGYPSAAIASVAKLASNLLLLTSLVGLAESVAVGRAGGLTDADLRALFSGSPLLGPGLTNRVDAIVDAQGPTWWTVALGVKDAGAALDIARSVGLDLPAAAQTAGRFEAAASRGLADRDIAAVTALYGSRSQFAASEASVPSAEASKSASSSATDA